MTQRHQIDRLAALYNLFIDSHFVPNILEEIYSTFQLLTVKEAKDVQKLTTEKSTETKGLLTTVHNCVYFASKVLEAQINLLEHLDRPTLAYLVENPRLESFCPQVKSRVHSILGTIHILRKHLYITKINMTT